MKIVIDISDKLMKYIVNGRDLSEEQNDEMALAIVEGTPLPEHHGRLIDADAFQKYCFNMNFDRRLSEGGLATINLYLEFQPTIIEGSEKDDE